MAVYFVQAGEAGLVKIGFTTHRAQRVKNLRTACPGMRLRAAVEGDKALEAGFHKQFASDRVEGEWFRPSDELLDLIGTLPPVADIRRSGPFETATSKHPLIACLSEMGITRTAFAKRVGVSPARITQLCSGTDRPSLSLAWAIDRETAGAVTHADWRPEIPDAEGGDQGMAAQ